MKSNKDSFKSVLKLKNLRVKELFTSKIFRFFIYLLATIVVLSFVAIVVFVVYQSTPVFKDFSFWKFLSNTNWKPGKNGSTEASYGLGMIILMTLTLLAISMLFAIPLTIFSTLFISEYLSEKMQKQIMNVVKLLASIPSVVFGLFARDQIGALFQLMGAPNNDNLMVAAVTMTFMATPTMISISYSAVKSVPDSYRFGSLGLGISKEKTTFKIVRKSANPQIIAAIILGMARVIGETMAIMMIAGNSTGGFVLDGGLKGFLFSSIRTLSATIGLEMTENSGSIHKSALFAIGLILFIIVFVINILIIFVNNLDEWKNKWNKKIYKNDNEIYSKNTKISKRKLVYENSLVGEMIKIKTENKFAKKTYSCFMIFFMGLSTIIIIAFTLWILGDITIKGLIGLREPSVFLSIDGGGGIFASLTTTLLLVFCVLMFAIPLSLGAAIYLSQYSNKNSLSTKIFRFIINLLASTPSIIFGIFGLSIFISLLGLPFSILAAALTMTIVVMPMLISNFETAINQVPNQYKEAGIGLGMNKTKVLFKIVLPNATEGIVTGIILAMAKIIGESAPIYLTLGTDIQLPTQGFLSQGTTLTTSIYMIVAEGIPSKTQNTLYLMSLITILLIVILNFSANHLSSTFVEKTHLSKIKILWKLKKENKLNYKENKLNHKENKLFLIPKMKSAFLNIRNKTLLFIESIKNIPKNIKMWSKRNKRYKELKKIREEIKND